MEKITDKEHPPYVCAATERGVIIADNLSGKLYFFSTSNGDYHVQEMK